MVEGTRRKLGGVWEKTPQFPALAISSRTFAGFVKGFLRRGTNRSGRVLEDAGTSSRWFLYKRDVEEWQLAWEDTSATVRNAGFQVPTTANLLPAAYNVHNSIQTYYFAYSASHIVCFWSHSLLTQVPS